MLQLQRCLTFRRGYTSIVRHMDVVDKVMSAITAPKQMATYSSPEQFAEVVYEAATDGRDPLRCIARADGKAIHAARLQVGAEAFRKATQQQFFG